MFWILYRIYNKEIKVTMNTWKFCTILHRYSLTPKIWNLLDEHLNYGVSSLLHSTESPIVLFTGQMCHVVLQECNVGVIKMFLYLKHSIPLKTTILCLWFLLCVWATKLNEVITIIHWPVFCNKSYYNLFAKVTFDSKARKELAFFIWMIWNPKHDCGHRELHLKLLFGTLPYLLIQVTASLQLFSCLWQMCNCLNFI
jgi:hypothetical protein